MNIDEECTISLRVVVERLFNMRKIGGSHTEIKNVQKRYKHASSNTKKFMDRFIKKSGWFLTKKSTGELHISLNPEKIGQIKEFLDASFTEDRINVIKKLF